ncbi:MAG: hypothetical protein ACOYMN_05550 [Roseimicrobium sp.]
MVDETPTPAREATALRPVRHRFGAVPEEFLRAQVPPPLVSQGKMSRRFTRSALPPPSPLLPPGSHGLSS